MKDLAKDLKSAVTAFLPDINTFTCQPFGNGLINSTYLIEIDNHPQKFILQKLNTSVFTSPDIISDNSALIQKAISTRNPKPVSLEFIASQSGKLFHTDEKQQVWRMSWWIPESVTLNNITSIDQAYLTAKAFGEFSVMFEGDCLHNIKASIPDFHNLSYRYHQFNTAIHNCSALRHKTAEKCIDYLQSNSAIVEQFESIVNGKKLPLRIQHGDTKISNILFDNVTQKPLCVIDWDTVMPGYFISDLGDMIRTIVPAYDENEADLNLIEFRTAYFHALLEGYKKAIPLTPAEMEAIPFAGRFMTYMQALRFLTDYLNNDVYYNTSYEEHNLVRAKNQCHLLQLIIENT